MWTLMWLNWSIATINTTLLLLDIYIYIYIYIDCFVVKEQYLNKCIDVVSIYIKKELIKC